MKRYLGWLSLIGGGVVAVLIGLSFVLPPEFRVERSLVIGAERNRIHEWVSDLSRWPQWADTDDAASDAQYTLGRTTRGVGATRSWTGTLGDGRITITQSSTDSGIRYDRFADGGRTKSIGTVAYGSHRDGTLVTWSLEGDVGDSVLGRYEAFFMSRTTGPQLEDGLNRLRARVEDSE